MKKIITILLVSLMVLTLTACNSKKEEETVKNEEPVVQEVVKQEETKQEEVTAEPEVKEEVVEETKEDTVDVTTLSYWVNFVNPDGSVVSRKSYKYGETPVYPTNPEYFDGVAYYSFREWDKKLSPVHMTQTYKALYDITGYVKSNDDTPTPPSGSTKKKIALSMQTTFSAYTLEYDDSFEYNVGETWRQYLDRYSSTNQSDFIVTIVGIKTELKPVIDGEENYYLGLFMSDSELVVGIALKDKEGLDQINATDKVDETDGKLYFSLLS